MGRDHPHGEHLGSLAILCFRLSAAALAGLRLIAVVGAFIAGIAESIDWVAHGFEIVQSHFPGWKFKAPDTVADWGLHGTLLVGPPRPVQALAADPVAALAAFTLDLSCDGRRIVRYEAPGVARWGWSGSAGRLSCSSPVSGRSATTEEM